MARKVPEVDVANVILEVTKQKTESLARELERRILNIQQNHEVLSKLCAAGIIEDDVMCAYNVNYGKEIHLKSEQTVIKARRALDCNFEEESKRLVDAKLRRICVYMRADKYPKSDILFSYYRKYTKEEEATKPCKIQRVLVQEAREERYEERLVCTVPE